MHLSLARDQVESLEDYTEPIEEENLPEKSRWYQRLIWRWFFRGKG